MLVEDQYGVGDVIDAGPATGTVESIGLRSTRIRDVNRTVWHLPNGYIERVGNQSQQWARAVLDVGVSYQTDIAHATEVIRKTAATMRDDEAFAHSIHSEPEVWGVEALGADSVTIRVALKTAPHDQFKLTRELRARVKAAFDDAGIEIPFAQRTVWHRGSDRAVGPCLSPTGRGSGVPGPRPAEPGGRHPTVLSGGPPPHLSGEIRSGRSAPRPRPGAT